MAIQFVSMKCPDCGAALNIEEERNQVFCSYCGSKIMVHNNNEYFYHHIDEARIKKAEADRIVRLKELENEELRVGRSDKLKQTVLKIWLPVSVIILILVLGTMFLGGEDGIVDGFLLFIYIGAPIIIGGAVLIFKVLPENEENKVARRNGGIKLPVSIFPYTEKNYETVRSLLEGAGFNNITCVNLHDVALGIFTKTGTVESIAVNGKDIGFGGKVYMPDAAITITYHGR